MKTKWRAGLALIVAVTSVTVFVAQDAQADAGNPILGTIKGTIVPDSSGDGVTVYVRGQWNWLSHTSDCNFDRAGTGVGIIWNDPNSPGYTVTKGSVSAGVGVQSSTDGNAQDQMVHPVDRGNQIEGYTSGTWTSTAQGYTSNTSGDYPSGQQFGDPPSNLPSDYAQWKGGCGREPLSATASKGTSAEATKVSCGNGTTTCANHPWGSWGYEKSGGLGYSHHYAHRSDVTSVCANFYDVHGGGKFNSGKFQLVGGSKEITVNGNGDNSIQTNAFNTAQGGNCVYFPAGPTIVTNASGPVTIGDDIHDTATISGLVEPPAGSTAGTITFTAYQPNADGTADTSCTTAAFTSDPVTVTTNGDYDSPPFTPTTAGTYEWKASYSGDANNPPASTACHADNEQSVVNRHSSSVPTGQKLTIADFARVAPTTGTGTPTGTVVFQLFTDVDCSADKLIYDSGPVTLVNGVASTDDAATQPNVVSTDGTYYWKLSYSGDGTFGPSTAACGAESIATSGNTPGVDP